MNSQLKQIHLLFSGKLSTYIHLTAQNKKQMLIKLQYQLQIEIDKFLDSLQKQVFANDKTIHQNLKQCIQTVKILQSKLKDHEILYDLLMQMQNLLDVILNETQSAQCQNSQQDVIQTISSPKISVNQNFQQQNLHFHNLQNNNTQSNSQTIINPNTCIQKQCCEYQVQELQHQIYQLNQTVNDQSMQIKLKDQKVINQENQINYLITKCKTLEEQNNFYFHQMSNKECEINSFLCDTQFALKQNYNLIKKYQQLKQLINLSKNDDQNSDIQISEIFSSQANDAELHQLITNQNIQINNLKQQLQQEQFISENSNLEKSIQIITNQQMNQDEVLNIAYQLKNEVVEIKSVINQIKLNTQSDQSAIDEFIGELFLNKLQSLTSQK